MNSVNSVNKRCTHFLHDFNVIHFLWTVNAATMILNLNIGILGHVDSGKTTLAKCLSDIASTACFDKNPQSQERCITLDLGFEYLAFSSLSVDL